MKVIITIMFFTFSYNAIAQKVGGIAQIKQSPVDNNYYLVYKSQDSYQAIPIKVTVENRKKIKALKDKFILFKGQENFEKQSSNESFNWTNKVTIHEMKHISGAHLSVKENLAIPYNETNYYLVHGQNKHTRGQGGIPLSDKTANSMIAVGGAALSVMAGPVSLVPLALLGIFRGNP